MYKKRVRETMTIIYYEGDSIFRDTNICDDHNVYLSNGQGCGTIWFKTVGQARGALEKDGIKDGRDLFDCSKCACHYSASDKKQKNYPFHACTEAKEEYAKKFEKLTSVK
jgi:hypothetical protein